MVAKAGLTKTNTPGRCAPGSWWRIDTIPALSAPQASAMTCNSWRLNGDRRWGIPCGQRPDAGVVIEKHQLFTSALGVVI
jgi:hypothetical protein